MENPILITVPLNESTFTGFEFKEEEKSVIIKFDNDEIVLTHNHDQDCCESVYADFDTFKLYAEQIKDKLKSLTIKGIKDIGFLVCFDPVFEYHGGEKVFIPCYNSQNGYYSDNLELIIKHGEQVDKIDITAYKEDNIC